MSDLKLDMSLQEAAQEAICYRLLKEHIRQQRDALDNAGNLQESVAYLKMLDQINKIEKSVVINISQKENP